MIRSLAQRLPFFYGWVIVGCTMCSSVVRQTAAVATLSIFVVPMTAEFDWSRTGISGAVSLGGILGALVAPFIGPMFDRHGSRALLVASAVVISGCCVALAGTQGLLWFYVSFSISRMTFSAPIEIGTTAAITKWFVRRRARRDVAAHHVDRCGPHRPASRGRGGDRHGGMACRVADACGHRHRVRRDPAMAPDGAQARGHRTRAGWAGDGPGVTGIGRPDRRLERDQFHPQSGDSHPRALAVDGLHVPRLSGAGGE